MEYFITIAGERSVLWNGARVAIKNGAVGKLELGGITLTDLPAGVLPLAKYSVSVNPQGVRIAGVIGVDVLRRLETLVLEVNRHIEAGLSRKAAIAQVAKSTGYSASAVEKAFDRKKRLIKISRSNPSS